MTLVDRAHYELLHGPTPDGARTEVQLDAASSLVRRIAKLHISRVVDDVITVDGTGTHLVLLPNLPVEVVSQVILDGTPLDGDRWDWWSWGGLRRSCGAWARRPRLLTVTYTHGWDPVPDWIVELVCSMVQRSTVDAVVERVQSETTGSQNIAYAVSAAGAALWLTGDEAGRLRALRGPR